MTSDPERRRELALNLLRDHLAHDGQLRFEVVGQCMAPLIEIGDEVGLQAARPTDLHVGDILLFDENGHFYTHRLLAPPAPAPGTWRLQTRGDRSPLRDHPWDAGQLIGRVVAVYKPGGRQVSLTTGYWPLFNRVVGHLSHIEVALLTRGERLRRRVFGARSTPLGSWLRRLLAAPGRIVVHLFARRS